MISMKKIAVAVALVAAAGVANAAFTGTQAAAGDDMFLVVDNGTTTYIRDLNTSVVGFGGSNVSFLTQAGDLFASTFGTTTALNWEVIGGTVLTDANGNNPTTGLYTSLTKTVNASAVLAGNNNNLYSTALINIIGDNGGTVGGSFSRIQLDSSNGNSTFAIIGEKAIGFTTNAATLGGTLFAQNVTNIIDPLSLNETVSVSSLAGTFSLASNGNLTYTATVAAVPEPGTWALMIAGLLTVGAIARRRTAV